MVAGESGGDATDACLTHIYREGCGTHCHTGTQCNLNGRFTGLGGCDCLPGWEESSCELPSGESGSTAEAWEQGRSTLPTPVPIATGR